MKLLCVMGMIVLACSNRISANVVEIKGDITLSSETLNLPQLLSHVEDIVGLIINSDDETSQIAYYEFKESLKIVYTLNCLHQNEASIILQTLDKCYANLINAANENPGKANILEQSISLFATGRNYDHTTLAIQSLQDWTETMESSKLKSAIEATDADLVYIQENTQWDVQKDASKITFYTPSLMLYNTHSFQNSSPKILIVKSKKNKSEYEGELGVDVKLGGKDHGKTSLYFKGEVKDKDGNYAKAKVSKEKGEDGYDCEIRAGKKKEKE